MGTSACSTTTPFNTIIRGTPFCDIFPVLERKVGDENFVFFSSPWIDVGSKIPRNKISGSCELGICFTVLRQARVSHFFVVEDLFTLRQDKIPTNHHGKFKDK